MENATLLDKALHFAIHGHYGQKDKGNNPYILHPLRLMMKMETEDEMVVAVLHDLLEDTHYIDDDLREDGFPENIIEAILAMTHVDGESYMDYIKRIKQNTLATKVKIADLKDNSDLSRIPNPSKRDEERVQKYRKALDYLLS